MARLLLFILAMALTAGSAFAGHVDTYGIGSRATAMAGAMTAGTNDAFSVYYNPAAMTRIKKKTFTIGSHFIDPSLEIKEFDAEVTSPLGAPVAPEQGSGIKDQSPLLIVPHMGYVQPIGDKMAFGIAFYVPYGLELSWDSNVNENPGAYNTYHSWYMREVITPSVAYKVNDKLSFGAGISIGKSKAGVERVRYVPAFLTNSALLGSVMGAEAGAATAAAYSDLEGSEFKTEMEDDFNYSFNIGVLYEMNEKLAFGLTFRSKSNTHMEGDTDVTPDANELFWPNQNVDASVDIDTPNQLQLGVQYSPTPKWNINLDITRTWWGAIDAYSVQFSDPFMGIASEEPYNRDWKNTFQYRLGVEYKLSKMVDLRAGYYYDPGVVPDETFDIQWPDSNKHVFSLGTGLHFERVTVDLAFQYIKIEPIHISGESENLNDTFYRDHPVYGVIHDAEVSAEAEGHLLAGGITVSYSF